MVDVTPLIPAGKQIIESYGNGQFHITGETWAGPVLVFPDATVPWNISSISELSVESLKPVLDAIPAVEVLLLGCGPRMTLIPSRLRQAIRDSGIVMDPMDTGAACRTYNVLLSEERRVAAALMPV